MFLANLANLEDALSSFPIPERPNPFNTPWFIAFVVIFAVLLAGLSFFIVSFYGTKGRARQAVQDYLREEGEGDWHLEVFRTGGYSRLWRVQATRTGTSRWFEVLGNGACVFELEGKQRA